MGKYISSILWAIGLYLVINGTQILYTFGSDHFETGNANQKYFGLGWPMTVLYPFGKPWSDTLSTAAIKAAVSLLYFMIFAVGLKFSLSQNTGDKINWRDPFFLLGLVLIGTYLLINGLVLWSAFHSEMYSGILFAAWILLTFALIVYGLFGRGPRTFRYLLLLCLWGFLSYIGIQLCNFAYWDIID